MTRKVFFSLSVLPLLFILLSVFRIVDSGAVYSLSGLQYGGASRLSHGQPTIDVNYGYTSEALGRRAALDVLSGKLPLWNHYEGLGQPLLGEMQSAALFPPTWLLALPHGQVIEQGLLQVLAALGAYLFLRKLGVCSKSAVVGALLFQFNGVFAWLRNAVYNPVAFLPWLFLTVELLYIAARENSRMARRLPAIALGGLSAALAIYAGFPEMVYLYSLLLLVWALFRFSRLNRPARLKFLLDLGLVCLVGLLSSLPVLLAFASFLPEAALGGHSDNGFYGAYLPLSSLLQTALPYVYGPIGAGKAVSLGLWQTAGYVGLIPCILAVTALFFPQRRAVKILVVAWIVFAAGMSFGVPGIYQTFQALPLVKIADSPRYVTVSWIFCFVVLAGLALDDIRQAKIADVRLALGRAVALVALLLTVSAALAWPALRQLWAQRPSPDIMLGGVLSAGAALAIIAGTAILAARANASRIAKVLGVLLVVEALVNFAVPYLYFPHHSKLDEGTIAFLKENSGFGRVVGTESGQVAANYGSYFGFSLLNHHDLPAPKRASDYMRDQLDPFFSEFWYTADIPDLTAEQRAERKALFRRRLERYAQAGVKYITSKIQPATLPFTLEQQFDFLPLDLKPSQRLEMAAPFTGEEKTSLTGLSLWISTHGGTADGALAATVCNADECAQGSSDLAAARDNSPLEIGLDRPLMAARGDVLRIVFAKEGGVLPVALFTATLTHASGEIHVQTDAEGLRPGTGPLAEFRDVVSDKASRLVHKGINFNIYELPGVRSYFEAKGCSLTAVSRDVVQASCPAPSRLVRLELAMPGWRASIDGADVTIGTVNGVFQEVALPKGDSVIRFVFMPAGMRAAILVAACTLAGVLFVLGYAVVKKPR